MGWKLNKVLIRFPLALLISFLALNFSFCPTYPRMVIHFSYDQNKREVFYKIQSFLDKENFKLLEIAPEDNFLFTDFKEYNWGTGRRFISLSIHVTDKITVTGMGKMDVPVSDLGPKEDLLKIKNFDKLPYSVQKKVFLPLIEEFEKLGFKKLNHWP